MPDDLELGGRKQTRYLRNGSGNKAWEVCTVPEDQYSDGWEPVLDLGKRMRR